MIQSFPFRLPVRRGIGWAISHRWFSLFVYNISFMVGCLAECLAAYQVTVYMYTHLHLLIFEVNNGNTRAICEISSKLTVKASE